MERRMEQRIYLAVDLKSFYASVECVERGLDPLTTNLVVADVSRTEKTICLAVSPALKAYGIPGRARLFEVVQRVRQINAERRRRLPDGRFAGKSCQAQALQEDPALELDYITAPPRMALYMEYSARVYQVYLKYIAPEDIHVYSIDEVFMDVTAYLRTYRQKPAELAAVILRDVCETTGITATAGIGTNLYLSKVAMDIVAKHVPQDENGARIAQLNERSYRRLLWDHRPLTDFWRVGRGYARKLEENGLYTMGDIARCSLGGEQEYHNEDLLYRLFGGERGAADRPRLGLGAVYGCGCEGVPSPEQQYQLRPGVALPVHGGKSAAGGAEMADLLALELVEKGLVTDRMVLTVGYDIENLRDPGRRRQYRGAVTADHYGRQVPKHAHGTANIGRQTSSARLILQAVLELYDRIVDPSLLVRRVNVTAAHLALEDPAAEDFVQMELFADDAQREQEKEREALRKERQVQQMQLEIKRRFGKNAILRGMSLQEGATARDRNRQIGGHRA